MDLRDLFASTDMEEVASGFEFTEGPVWHPDGYLLFSDIPANTIYRWQEGREPISWREPSGHSNGLTFDRQGRLVACEHGNRCVSRTEVDGTLTALATHYHGKRLNSPNDIVVRSDGSVYFTDPPYGVDPEERELAFSGVYRIPPDGGDLELLMDDFERPNGLAFSPDERILYVDDTWRRHIRAFDVADDGGLSSGRVFAEMPSDMEGGPDGMKVDVEGNIYSTGPGGLWIYQPDGHLVGTIMGPHPPANLAFGGPERKTLYLTARTSLYRLTTRIAGMPVF
ncbi:MAG: SMP-30/gluconolactonase/LRE family protein [Anaerolineales bacterium]